MPKTSRAPKGLYTAGEAIKRLNMAPTTFHHYVKTGKIKKVTPPGRNEGYYEKAYIDKMARASQLFAIQYAEDPSTFSVAKEEDLQGIYDVIVSLWGSLYATPTEVRKQWFKKNQEIDYVVKKEGVVTGYVSIMPLKHDTIEKLMSGKIRGWDITADDILNFEPGKDLECYTGIAIRSGLYKQEKYGIRLLLGIIDVLKDMANRGIHITKLYAVSDTPDGIKISKGLGFEEKPPAEGSSFNQYILDLDNSDTPFAKEYREILHKKTSP